jgi:subtilisin family serine protease
MALSDITLGSGEVLPYGIQMVQADLVESLNEAAKKICIIDSGYSPTHEDLQGGTVTQSTTTGSGSWDKDSCGHGSHVAGTIRATADNNKGVIGVIPGAALHIVKVFGNDVVGGGNCAWTYSSTLVNALNECQAAGAKITSMSLGGSIKSRTEEVAFANAYNNARMLHIAAAGNAGNNTTSYPGGYASVISVAAVDANESVASFSQKNKDVELAAPGVGVRSTVPWVETNTLSFGGTVVAAGGHVEFSARTSGTSGVLVNGGQCTAVGAWSANVVLCQRGTNSFYEKVQNVKKGGGVAAVIYNNVASDPSCGDLAATLGDGNTSDIPAIGVSCDAGVAAIGKVGDTGTVVSQITTAASGYEAWDGTSMATPHVSGVAALVWSCYPTATNQQIRNALTATAKDKGTGGRDNSYGYGIVQAKAAIQYLGGQNTTCSFLPSSKYLPSP